MRILCWNVNGLRACLKKGFLDWLEASRADVVALQEIRSTREQLPKHARDPSGYAARYVPAAKLGYSGVGLLSRVERTPDAVTTSLGVERFDVEGRFMAARFGKLVVINCYFPNGSGKNRDHSRVPYKLEFYQEILDRATRMANDGDRVLVMGDFNTAHQPIDLARPKQNTKTSGFTPTERDALGRWLEEGGFTDTFRHLHPDEEVYSWWSQRRGVRERNVGWRIDYVLASEAVMPFLEEAFILTDVTGSDHCPIGVVLDDAVME